MQLQCLTCKARRSGLKIAKPSDLIANYNMRPSLCEDGTNVPIGTKFIVEHGRRVLPWYIPAASKAPSDWKDKWKKLRDRFESIIDAGCVMECFLIQRRIPQSRQDHEDFPRVLQSRKMFRRCNGLWIQPSNLFSPTGEPLVGLFPFNNVRGEPMLNSKNQPVAFRLGSFHYFDINHEIESELESTFQIRRQLIELAKDGTNLIYQLPSEVACSLWRNVLSGFSKTENKDDSLWYDALFQLSLVQQPGSPLCSTRYDWKENGSIGLVGRGLFPRLPDFDSSTSFEAPRIPRDEDYPMAYYAKLPDLARASVAAIDEILQLASVAATAAETKTPQIAVETEKMQSTATAKSLQELLEETCKAKTNDEKGRTLEELVTALFSTIPGFRIWGSRVITETEEIDLQIGNGSSHFIFHKEEAIILAECKYWAKKCGKNEFVVFRSKIENRNARCSLGFLISWNGFADTITKEMLRGSHERLLIVPIDGSQIQEAVQKNSFADLIESAWNKATMI